MKIFLYLFTVLSCIENTHAMTIEEKVGQVMMVHFQGEAVNEDARTLIQGTKVGGIIYYNWSNGLNSPQQVRMLSFDLQKLTESNKNPIPLLIAVDQEGGVVSRLKHGFTEFPGNRALGETGDPNLAEIAAQMMSRELQDVGVNMNLAPVVDINCNPKNPAIGIRSFGDDPETVLLFVESTLKGYAQNHLISTLKHFPGHGDVTVDSHENLPVIRKPIQELEQMELLPFTKLADKADAIMTAHLLVTALDQENCSTLSEKTLSYLKNTIGFKGVIITDSLLMKGVLKKCHTVDEAAIKALNAGCDILLLGGKQLIEGNTDLELSVKDVQRIHSSIVNAVKKGRVPEARLNDAVRKILKLKERYLSTTSESEPTHRVVSTFEHQEIACKIATLALKSEFHNHELISSLKKKKVFIAAPEILSNSIHQTDLMHIGKTTETWFFSNRNPTREDIEWAKKKAESADILLVCSYNAWKHQAQQILIRSLLDMGKPDIILVTRDPLDASLFPNADIIFTTFSPATPSLQAVADQLMERQ